MGFIKLDREILKWEWYDDPATKIVFLHLLLKANYEDGKYRGETVKAGQVVFGRKKYAEALGLSERNVRTAINHLHETGEISTVKKTNKFTIINIEKWGKYQGDKTASDQQTDQQVTSNRPASDQQVTTSKKGRREERKNKENIYNRFSPPTIEEVKAYCIERGNNVDPEKFIDFYESKGWIVGKTKMKDWRAAVRNWERNSASKSSKNDLNDFYEMSREWARGG